MYSEYKNLTFYAWLNSYENITKREFREFSEEEKIRYKNEYVLWKKS